MGVPAERVDSAAPAVGGVRQNHDRNSRQQGKECAGGCQVEWSARSGEVGRVAEPAQCEGMVS